MEIIIILILILINGIFSMSEMALVSSRKFKLENARKKGNLGAKTALDLADNPTKFLSTVQIGITLIGILVGIYSGESITNDLTIYISKISILAPYASSISSIIVVFIVTYVSIVLGELLPKRLGMAFPEPIIILLSKPMQILSKITSPFVWLLTASNNLLLKILGIKNSGENHVSEEEIKSIIADSAVGGEIDTIEQDIVERVFELGDRKINTLMTHKADVVYFSKLDSWEIINKKINAEKHSAYPVVENDNMDNVIGVVLIKDLFNFDHTKDFSITDYMRTPMFLDENAPAYQVLEQFKREKNHYGLIIDEYGNTIGMVTMDDVVDALVGDMAELDNEDYSIQQRTDNTWLVDGQYAAIDFGKKFGLEEYLNNDFTTVAGLIIHYYNKIPKVGDVVTIGNFTLEIIDKDGQRIDKILLTKLSIEQEILD